MEIELDSRIIRIRVLGGCHEYAYAAAVWATQNNCWKYVNSGDIKYMSFLNSFELFGSSKKDWWEVFGDSLKKKEER